jgi:hypothetical protein
MPDLPSAEAYSDRLRLGGLAMEFVSAPRAIRTRDLLLRRSFQVRQPPGIALVGLRLDQL